MNHLQITVNGLIPRNALNTKKEAETVHSDPIATRQVCKLRQCLCLFPTARQKLSYPNWSVQQNLLHLHLIGKGNKKLELPIKKKTKQRQDHNPRKRSTISKNI